MTMWLRLQQTRKRQLPPLFNKSLTGLYIPSVRLDNTIHRFRLLDSSLAFARFIDENGQNICAHLQVHRPQRVATF